jgi:hypothetical protein
MSTPITLPNQLYERVKQTAQNKQQSVDEYVSELIASALDENGTVPMTNDEALAQEARAWESLYPMLKEKYPGQYIAIHQGQVLDVDEDALSLNRRVRTNHPNNTIWISQVKEEPFPEIFMRSPRLER